jgi:hypothetical protein
MRPAFQPTCGSNLVRADDWHLLNKNFGFDLFLALDADQIIYLACELHATSVASAIIASAIHGWHVSPSIAGAASTSMTTFTS